jgi:hypothetical protein
VDPDRWLERVHGQAYVRHVGGFRLRHR